MLTLSNSGIHDSFDARGASDSCSATVVSQGTCEGDSGSDNDNASKSIDALQQEEEAQVVESNRSPVRTSTQFEPVERMLIV